MLVNVSPLLLKVQKEWSDFLSKYPGEAEIELFRKHERTGRPLGEEQFIEKRKDRNPIKPIFEIKKSWRKKVKIDMVSPDFHRYH